MLENKIQSQIIKKRSFLCVGLDVDINKIPKSLLAKKLVEKVISQIN